MTRGSGDEKTEAVRRAEAERLQRGALPRRPKRPGHPGCSGVLEGRTRVCSPPLPEAPLGKECLSFADSGSWCDEEDAVLLVPDVGEMGSTCGDGG